MATREHYETKMVPGNFYHVYNRSISDTNLFHTPSNYAYFLQLLERHLAPVLDVYAWALMPNHFHLLVEIRPHGAEESAIQQDIHSRFRKMFQVYALALNKQERRHGGLFQSPFKRVMVDSPDYFTQLVFYIHSNPQRHGFVDDFRRYKWTSYHSILEPGPTKLKRESVLNWFGGRDTFESIHAEGKLDLAERMLIDDH